VALLRGVNVGGTGKLAMTDLKAMCEAAGFANVRTYIASGNALFESGLSEGAVKAALEARLHAHGGRPVSLAVRTAAEMADVAAHNPFAGAPGNRVVAIFLDDPPPRGALEAASGKGPDEALALGRREIYVRYGSGMASSKLRIPAARVGTARNMNTVTKLAALAAG
jgi:uncharacterized protein (DUF1697 family)